MKKIIHSNMSNSSRVTLRDGKGCCLQGTELAIMHQDDLKKRTYIKVAACRNECFEKMNYHPWFTPHHTTTQKHFYHPWCSVVIVRQSSTTTNQQRQPWPSLLYSSFIYDNNPNMTIMQKDTATSNTSSWPRVHPVGHRNCPHCPKTNPSFPDKTRYYTKYSA